jgi:hypothetical protein
MFVTTFDTSCWLFMFAWVFVEVQPDNAEDIDPD